MRLSVAVGGWQGDSPAFANPLAVRLVRGKNQARPDLMMVEFIGAAGAGKSFLSGRVLDALTARGMAAGNFDLIEIDRAAPRNVFLAARTFYLSVMARQKTLSRFAHTFTSIARYSIRRELCEQLGGIHITSEGLLHRIITIHRNSRALGIGQLADMLYRRIQPPDVAVFVEVSARTAYARRSTRNRANDLFTRESVRADVEIIAGTIEVMAHIKRTLHPSMQVVCVSAEKDGAEEAVAEIVAALTMDDLPQV